MPECPPTVFVSLFAGLRQPSCLRTIDGCAVCFVSAQMRVKLRPPGCTPMSPAEFRRTRLKFHLRALERETHFCPGLAVEPVSHRRKDRNSSDLSFRFHECWSSGTAASDGSNSVSIFGAGWTRTKYSRPISSCRIGSGNISASRAYCERCAAIAAIFCWT